MAFPQSQPVCHLGHLFDPDFQRQIVVVDVTAFPKRGVQVHRPVPDLFPAGEFAIADFHIAWAIDGLVWLHHARFQSGQGGDHLERRSGRVGILNCL